MNSITDALKKIILLVVVLTGALVFGVKSSSALEELKVYRGFLILEGKIVPGDYKKVHDFVGQKTNFEKITGGGFLCSPGGNGTEVLKNGPLISAFRLKHDAPSRPA